MFLHFLGELQRSLRVPLFQSYSRVLGTQIYAADLSTMRNRQQRGDCAVGING